MQRDDILKMLQEVATEILGVDPSAVTADAKFKDDLDADSLDLVEVVMALEEKLDIAIPEEDLADIVTVGQAADVVMQKLGVASA